MPFPLWRMPSDIGHGAAEPSMAFQLERLLPGPSSTIASLGGGIDTKAPGVTTGGRGRRLSCTRHFPSGCIGVSS